MVPFFMTPPIVFVIYIAGFGGGLDPSTVFTSLTLFNLLLSPLIGLFQWMPMIVGVFGYLNRVEDFLREESRHDFRVMETSNIVSSSYSKSNAHNIVQNGRTESHAPRVDGGPSTAILVRAGSFGWDKEHDTLHDISLTIERSHLTMIIGPVASGKSTLCAALLGETPFSKGVVQFNTSSSDIAFCDQTPFLQNASLKQNIIGVSDFEATWYNKVLDAVALREDLAALPKGDQSVIGSDGISLSGGQKQRLAVARAVYARKEIAIFDDVLSGLDTRTQRDVFNQVFGPRGLLRLNKTTVILATHATKFLSSADLIVALGRDGKIVEQGTFEDLKEAKGYLESLDVQHYKEDDSTLEGYQRDDLLQKLDAPAHASINSSSPNKPKGIYSFYLSSVGWLNLSILCVLVFSLALTGAPALFILKKWTDPDTSHTGASNAFYLGTYFLLSFGSLLAVCLLARIVFTTVITRSGLRLHSILVKTTMGAPMTFFSETDKGVTTNRFSQDIQLVDGELPVSYLNLALATINGLGQVVLLLIASPFIAFTLPFIAVVFVVVQKVYLKTTRRLRVLDIESKSPLVYVLVGSAQNPPSARTIRYRSLPLSIIVNSISIDFY